MRYYWYILMEKLCMQCRCFKAFRVNERLRPNQRNGARFWADLEQLRWSQTLFSEQSISFGLYPEYILNIVNLLTHPDISGCCDRQSDCHDRSHGRRRSAGCRCDAHGGFLDGRQIRIANLILTSQTRS